MTRKVPFLDLERQHNPIRGEVLAELTRIFDAKAFINGLEVKAFETELAQYLGVDGIVACGCATDGIFATLKAFGVGPGDEVITTVHTAFPTAEAITLTGAQVVFVDILGDTYNLDPQEVVGKITPKTKAIVAVHIYGQPADLDALVAISRLNEIHLIEDCAQALGATYKGSKVGTIGDAAVFSFFPSKPLGGIGDGGAVTARQPEVAHKIRMFCNHGRQTKYRHELQGINSRLDNLNAAMLGKALPHLDAWNRSRRRVAARYTANLRQIPQIELPHVPIYTDPVWHIFSIRIPARDELRQYLHSQGISTGVHYPVALNLQPAYDFMGLGPGTFPTAEYHCAHTLSLPMFPEITGDEVDYVCSRIRKYFTDNQNKESFDADPMVVEGVAQLGSHFENRQFSS